MTFLPKMQMFKGWGFDKLKYFYLDCTKVWYQNNDPVFKENEAANSFYIILQGDFAVS